MINIRFHIVSLIAVFLALAVGIFMGSTLLDRATVEYLQASMDRLQTRNSELSERGKALAAEQDRDDKGDALLEERQGELLGGALSGQAVVMVAISGIDAVVVRKAGEAFESAGADLLGTLWIEEGFNLNADSAVGALSKEFEIDGEPNRDAVIRAFAHAFGRIATPPEDRAVQSNSAREDAERLIDATNRAAATRWEPSEAGAPLNLATDDRVRVVVLSGENAKIPESGFLTPFLSAFTDAGQRLVFGEVMNQRAATDRADALTQQRGVMSAQIRDAERLKDDVTTVDNVDRLAGRWCMVWALQGLDVAEASAYGDGPEASALFPDPTP